MQVYILYSETLGKYYVGQTNNIKRRLAEHNSGQSKYTRTGTSWTLIKMIECASRQEAVKLEAKIKKRGIGRYLEDLKNNC